MSASVLVNLFQLMSSFQVLRGCANIGVLFQRCVGYEVNAKAREIRPGLCEYW